MPLLLYAFKDGPEAGRAGVPSEGTCAMAGCHSGPVNPPTGGKVRVEFPGPQTYAPGVKQRLAVIVEDSNQRRWGFQLTARQASDEKIQAGSFTNSDGNTQVICSANNLVEGPCGASRPLQFIEHTRAGTRLGQTGSARFEFDWTPPSAAVGDIVIYVAGNAANGDDNNTGDRIYTATYRLTAASAGGNAPSITEVINGAGYQNTIAAGSWVGIKGHNLAAGTRPWRADEIVNGKLPTSLDGVSATINSKPAFVSYISPTQINVQAPSDEATGPVPVEVTVNGVKSNTFNATIQRFSPGFFPWDAAHHVIATRLDFSFVGTPDQVPGGVPAKVGEVILLWGTGFGPTDPAFPAGQAVDKANNLANTPAVRIGDVQAEVLGGGLSAPSAGVYVIAIRVPNLDPGDYKVIAEIGGVSSPADALITVQR